MSIPLHPTQTTALPSALRNTIYSALLSSGGIRSIEATLTQQLQSTGFHAHLRDYMTLLYRSGQATTAQEAYGLAMARVRECMRGSGGGEGEGQGEGDADADADADADGLRNRDEKAGGLLLRVPDGVVKEGIKVVRRELERVVDIDMD